MRNRFFIPQYIVFSIRLRIIDFWLKLKSKGQSPYQDAVGKIVPRTCMPLYKKQEFFTALSHLNVATANRFYQDNPFITVQLIKALVYWNEPSKSNDKFLNMVAVIINACSEDSENFYYPLNIPYKDFQLSSPWISGLIQGKLLSLLVRAYWASKNPEYLIKAEKCISALTKSIENNGTIRVLDYDLKWSEEYPIHNKPSMVLNGHLFTLIGLADYLTEKDDPRVRALYNQLFSSTLSFLPFYRRGGGLLYSLALWKQCNVHYLCIMVPLTKHLYQISNVPEINELHLFLNKKCPRRIFQKLLG